MHIRFGRSAAALVIAAASTLVWVPTANAEPSDPTPSFTAVAETPTPDAGSVEITTKDTAGGVLSGASFLLLDSAGQEAARGRTDASGKLTFRDLRPGVYRLKQTVTGSPLHDTAADQDVIVTPSSITQVTIDVLFKPAKLLLQAKDNKTGRLLPGATVTIGTGSRTLLTLTTGAAGTASGALPMSTRSAKFWVRETRSPAGYDLYTQTKTFTAGPGSPVTVTVANAKTAPETSDKPTDEPTASSTREPSNGTGAATSPAPGSPTPDTGSSAATAAPVRDSRPNTPTGSLAHTGTTATPWLIGGTTALLVVGGGAFLVARRIRAATRDDELTEEV
ncbi:SpaA isopeptide-forming pilin-related protein [Streptomyces sp. NPDC057682]|uniref:SpaA isopeptide-forming pilin-related protein n=1 Tax=Streptomyces sp. NPDC057682 TaxID=3346210 RepID=UPI00367A52D7